MTKKKTAKSWLIAAGLLAGLVIGVVVGAGLTPKKVVKVTGMSAEKKAYLAEMADDDAFLGDPAAPVLIVEFSDFQCPFCRRYVTQTFPKIKRNYIDTGKVKYVYRDYALGFHPGAIPAARAAECARGQGSDQFWAVHRQIFAKQNEQGSGTIQFTEADIKSWLKEIGSIDYTKWETCFDSGKYIAEIAKDTQDGMKYGVTGTPSFFINGIPLSGAQPFPVFRAAIERALVGI